jgi:enoyl-CoA hydratase/carnithine racemase
MTVTTLNPPATLDWPAAGIARLTLARGDTHNTITNELLASIEDHLSEVETVGARVLIVTGSGASFCGGAHIRYFTDPASPLFSNPRAIRDDYVRRILRVFARLREGRFVAVAAINGHAFGGGCELALACDFRLMSIEARIGLTETTLGAVAGGGGVQLLSRILGRAKALEFILPGERWTADDARSIGLVTAVHPAAELEEASIAFARRFLRCSPISIAETKRALYRCETATAEEADRIALDAVAVVASGPEWREGMTAFTEKRSPSYRLEA